MAINTYATLLTAIDNWLARPGILTTYEPDWIVLSEQRIAYGAPDDSAFPSRPLRVRAMEKPFQAVIQAVTAGGTSAGSANAQTAVCTPTVTSLTTGLTVQFTAGSGLTNTAATTFQADSTSAKSIKKGSALDALAAGDIIAGVTYTLYYDGTQYILLPGDPGIPLPSNYLAFRELYLDTIPKRTLDHVAPEVMNSMYAGSMAGFPRVYTIEGDTVRFGPVQDGTYTVRGVYYQKFPALTVSNTTNWLILNAPGIYLYGCLLEAMPFIRNDPRLTLWYGMYKSACNGLQAQDQRDRHSGRLTIRPQVDKSNPWSTPVWR